MTTGQRIKDRRKAIGLSAERLAEMLGVSPATIYRYENGDIEKVPGDRLGPIASVLRTTPAYLMGWVEDENEQPTQILIASNRAFDLTPAEQTMIHKFRSLDDRGQAAVLNVLDHEYNSLPGSKADAAPKEA